MAERYDKAGRLIGNFFFFRGHGDRSIIARLVPTLSFQLYHCLAKTQASIRSAIDANPHINSISLTYQFQKLIIGPIRAANMLDQSGKPRIIIIDGLDECDDRELMRDFIEAVISAFQEHDGLRLRVLITSRVEEHIRETLETSAARSVVHRLSLGDFDVRADIHTFFQSRLSTTYEKKHRVMKDLSPQWPSQSDLDLLVTKSDGSFLWAITLIKLIDGPGFSEDNLRKALTAEDGLDFLYAQVLRDAPRDENFDRVISTVMLLTEPLPIVFLAYLLGLRPKDIVQTSLGLQSILMIPGDDDEPITLSYITAGFPDSP